ncbi:chronic myelogenous leukemia tumor antigen 66 [Anaeramoeba flamelloides]|uniref:Chronic myelogenous leukemia tumor antigen 66 n=1 Tax=Anaeramoeba flamelloides TaxID=1746091 RepID=A0ABQ8XCU1_9EUKA|nr:chronic myelogenous leukemia tumor antigen 66 [Anaeramoeba flamelloides]
MRSNLRPPYSFQQSPSSITIICFHEGNSNQIPNQKEEKEKNNDNEKKYQIEVSIDELNFSIKRSNKPIIEGKLYAHIEKEFDQFSISQRTTSVVIYKKEEERWPVLILDKNDKGDLDPFSEYQLAYYTMRIKKDQEKAIGLLKASARRSCSFAVMTIANSFTNPNLFQIKHNKQKAIKWWTRAYEAGCSPTAELSLGSLYFDERQNADNDLDSLKQAKKWFSLVGDENPVSCCYLGKIELAFAELAKKKSNPEESLKGFNEAARLFKKSAFEMGLMEAYFYFGIMQIEGYLETGKNFMKGKDLILMSVTQGDTFNVPPRYSNTLTKVYQYEETHELGDLNSESEHESETSIALEKIYHNFDQSGDLTTSEDYENFSDLEEIDNSQYFENSEQSDTSEDFQQIIKNNAIPKKNTKKGKGTITNTQSHSNNLDSKNYIKNKNTKPNEKILQIENKQELPNQKDTQNMKNKMNQDEKFEWLFTIGSITAVGVANLLFWKTRK